MKPYDIVSLNSNSLLLFQLSWLLNFKLPICESWRRFLSEFRQETNNWENRIETKGSQLSHRYRVNWLDLNVNQHGLTVDRVLSKSSQKQHCLHLINLLNDYFDNNTFHFEFSNDRFYMQSSMSLPESWPSVFQLYKQNLMSLVKFDEDKQWLVLLNEAQMLLGQNAIEIDNVVISGFWPEVTQHQFSESSVIVDDDGVCMALKSDFDGLENWLSNSLSRAISLANKNANFILLDGNFLWQKVGFNKLKSSIKNWVSRV